MAKPDYCDVYFSGIAGDEAHVQDLHALGITMLPPRGTACYWPDKTGLWKEIGRVVVWAVDGAIQLFPYEDLEDYEENALRGAGWAAWEKRPHGRHPEGWWRGVSRHHGTFYEHALHIRASVGDPLARTIWAIRTARTFAGWQDRQFRAHYNDVHVRDRELSTSPQTTPFRGVDC
ncbi:hypothetical protein ACWIGI_28500 [Nocardia sp. NPDC055321]